MSFYKTKQIRISIYRESSEETPNHYSIDDMQVTNVLEAKDNINLLESQNTIEDKNEEIPDLNSIVYANRICKIESSPSVTSFPIVGIDKQKEPWTSNDGNMERPK